MTAKTRKSKRKHSKTISEPKNYRFFTNSQEVIISAHSLIQAKTEFQNRFGFWPEKEYNYGSVDPTIVGEKA